MNCGKWILMVGFLAMGSATHGGTTVFAIPEFEAFSSEEVDRYGNLRGRAGVSGNIPGIPSDQGNFTFVVSNLLGSGLSFGSSQEYEFTDGSGDWVTINIRPRNSFGRRRGGPPRKDTPTEGISIEVRASLDGSHAYENLRLTRANTSVDMLRISLQDPSGAAHLEIIEYEGGTVTVHPELDLRGAFDGDMNLGVVATSTDFRNDPSGGAISRGCFGAELFTNREGEEFAPCLIPEPSTSLLCFVAAFGFFTRRRRSS